MSFTYGVIEGLYDQLQCWNWDARSAYVDFCSRKGFDFYIYAPKNDPYLREQWRDPWPESELERLTALSESFRKKGVRFGLGFTRYEVQQLNTQTQDALKNKLSLINTIKPDILCILFDDFKNDVPHLAQTQADIADFIAGQSNASHFQVVGTYYSKDPLLFRAYGTMPKGYWSDLGRCLDKRFDIFWTGDHVISLGYEQAGLEEMAELFQRKPFLWDNYPVNDPGWLMCRLPVYAFTGRPWQISEWCSGHAVNPMIQPLLSMIPLTTLADIYQQKDGYQSYAAFRVAVREVCGEALAQAIEDNLIYLTQEGYKNFSEFTAKRLKTTFEAFSSPRDLCFSREILHWLAKTSETSTVPGDSSN